MTGTTPLRSAAETRSLDQRSRPGALRWLAGPHDLPDLGPFARASWFTALEHHALPDGLRLPCVRLPDSLAVLPLTPAGPAALASATSWYAFRADPINTGPAADAALSRLLRDLRAHAARLTLAPVSDAGTPALRRALAAAGWRVEASIATWRHWTPLAPVGFDAWWRTRPSRLRATVRRRQGALCVRITPAPTADDWAAYEAIYADSWKPPEGAPDFLRAFAADEAAAGRLRMGFADTADGPVAAQLWTVDGGGAFIHKLAQRRAADRLSPGSVLTAALCRHVIDTDRVAFLDYGTGDDAYKADWMDRREPLWRLDAFNLADARAWAPFARARLGALRHRWMPR